MNTNFTLFYCIWAHILCGRSKIDQGRKSTRSKVDQIMVGRLFLDKTLVGSTSIFGVDHQPWLILFLASSNWEMPISVSSTGTAASEISIKEENERTLYSKVRELRKLSDK